MAVRYHYTTQERVVVLSPPAPIIRKPWQRFLDWIKTLRRF